MTGIMYKLQAQTVTATILLGAMLLEDPGNCMQFTILLTLLDEFQALILELIAHTIPKATLLHRFNTIHTEWSKL